jgi:hypothetical protein
MAEKGPKGIVSPWARQAEPARQAAPPDAWKTEQDDPLNDVRDRVRFPGQMRTIHVRPLHGKGDPNLTGIVQLARGLLALLAKVPAARDAFTRQSIGFTKPTQAHMSLDFGGVPFYAVVATAEPETAKRMVIDRIAFAITEAKSRSAEARTILEQHHIEVSNS